MDSEKFGAYLKKQRRSQGTIENCLRFNTEFEAYLRENCGVMELDKADPEDLESYIEWLKEHRKSPNSYLWGIGRYYEFAGNEDMRKFASGWRQQLIDKSRSKRKGLLLKKIMGINLDHIQKLDVVGVMDVMGLLEAGKTKAARKKLARESGVPEAYLLELVQLADLTRIVDIKAVRVRLLYEAGVETLEALSEHDPEELQIMLAETNQEKKYLKRAPTLVEAKYWVSQAQILPKSIEY